jgi:hypothetical protein
MLINTTVSLSYSSSIVSHFILDYLLFHCKKTGFLTGSAKSYLRKGFLLYEEWALCSVMTCIRSIKKKNSRIFFDSVQIGLVSCVIRCLSFTAVFGLVFCTVFNTTSSAVSQIPLCRRMLRLGPVVEFLKKYCAIGSD